MAGRPGNQQLLMVEETIKQEDVLEDDPIAEVDPHPLEMHAPLLILFGYQFNGEKNVC